MENPESFGEVTVQMVQPYQADKAYLCPGCHREIPEGLGHLVVTPVSYTHLRAHETGRTVVCGRLRDNK